MNVLEIVNVLLAGLNVALAVALGVVYWRNHREIRSPFTMGLLLFAAFLVVHNVLVIYHFAIMMGDYSGRSESLMLAENVLQAGASGALVVATLR